MRIAIAGTHGAGKTVLAEALSAALNLPLIPEQACIVAAEMNVRCCHALLTRPNLAAAFQWNVLEHQIAKQKKFPEGFVADRCTLDAIAYWHLYQNGNDQNPHPDTSRYVFKARLHAWKGLGLLVYISPAIAPEEDGFRLKTHHIEADVLIRREILLLRESNRVPVLTLKSNALDERLAEVGQIVGQVQTQAPSQKGASRQ